MPLDPPHVREAKRTLRAHQRAKRAAQPTRQIVAPKLTRPPNPKADRGRERDPLYLAFVRRQRCVVGPRGCAGSVEAAHVRYSRPGVPNPGLQVKPSDRYAVPLCRAHHREGADAQHGRGERQWWEAHRLDPYAIAASLFAAYQNGAGK